ncbi:hypothetical protein ABT288_30890 [Streptomyces sp. NPDC001093]|uniref:hypothetical protein n=1 Tax=Streptomyces sp. NPDC001093 TaxID=3154376 RepID=UPI00332028D9
MLEARKAREADDADTTLPEPEPRRREPTVTFLTARRLAAHLPPDTRRASLTGPYDQLLGRTRGTTAASKGEQMP